MPRRSAPIRAAGLVTCSLALLTLAGILLVSVGASLAEQVAVVDPEPLALSWDYEDDPVPIVRAGQSVTWINIGRQPHTITARDGSFDSGILESGESWSHTFPTAGSFAFHCRVHPSLSSLVIVE